MAPLPILDYVAAHELCHVPHKNHSPRFWKCLGNVMPDYKMRRQELRRMGNGLVV
jgi:predicted metal-dependent hydrolase